MNALAKKTLWLLGTIVLLGGVAYAARYGGLWGNRPAMDFPEPAGEGERNETGRKNEEAVPIVVETVVTGLEVPWSLVFTAPNRMLVTARPGRIYQIVNEKLDANPIAVFEETVSEGEEGLMGLAPDPAYEENRLLYLSLAYQKGGKKVLKVMRFRDEGTSLSNAFTLLDDVPAATYHAGSRVKFGPDGKLYVTTGDATDKNLSQNLESPSGKILRINPDGSLPAVNPFPGSPVYSYGHRNPQGIAWHPQTGEMYATEHGPSLFDGPAGGDEVNHIVKGGNYGWPLVSHEKRREGTVAPLVVFTPAVAPASAAFYRSDRIPQFKNHFFFGALKGEGLFRAKFDENNPDKVLEYGKLSEVNVGRIRDVIEGPDGALYFTTSNRDGRGTARPGDDKIYRLKANK